MRHFLLFSSLIHMSLKVLCLLLGGLSCFQVTAFGQVEECLPNGGCEQISHEFTPVGTLFESEQDWCWTFLPQGVLYPTYLASQAEPRLAIEVYEESDQGRLIDPSIGGRIPLLRFGSRDRKEGFQFDLLGGAKLRQDAENELDVLATDYRFDLPITYLKGKHAFKVGYYHVSSHAGDEFLLKNPNFNRLNYVRDAFAIGYSYYPVNDLRLYHEVGYAFNVDISEPLELQLGVDYFPSSPTGIKGAPFAAINGHLREELDFGGNVALQAGWAWRGEGLSAGLFRTGLYIYNGGSPQFSFYADHEQSIGWGLWYDF